MAAEQKQKAANAEPVQQYSAPNIITKKETGTTFVDKVTGGTFSVKSPKIAEILASKKRYEKA